MGTRAWPQDQRMATRTLLWAGNAHVNTCLNEVHYVSSWTRKHDRNEGIISFFRVQEYNWTGEPIASSSQDPGYVYVDPSMSRRKQTLLEAWHPHGLRL